MADRTPSPQPDGHAYGLRIGPLAVAGVIESNADEIPEDDALNAFCDQHGLTWDVSRGQGSFEAGPCLATVFRRLAPETGGGIWAAPLPLSEADIQKIETLALAELHAAG